jgi:hypothetical protein
MTVMIGTGIWAAYIQRGDLDVGVLVFYPALQRAHGISRLHRLGANNVGDFEVERHVFSRNCQHCSSVLCGS